MLCRINLVLAATVLALALIATAAATDLPESGQRLVDEAKTLDPAAERQGSQEPETEQPQWLLPLGGLLFALTVFLPVWALWSFSETIDNEDYFKVDSMPAFFWGKFYPSRRRHDGEKGSRRTDARPPSSGR